MTTISNFKDLVQKCGKRPPNALLCYKDGGTSKYHYCMNSSEPRNLECCYGLYEEFVFSEEKGRTLIKEDKIMKEKMVEKIQIPHTIVRPEDQALVERLRRKYKEYQERMGEYSHPELRLLQTPNTFFKAYILNAVLVEERAESDPLVDKIRKDFPEAFEINKSYFLDAWAVIWDYCENAGKHSIKGKTGKPGLAE